MNPIASVYLERGINHFRANQFDHAIVNFDAALRIDPNEPYARYNRATALLSIGDYARGFQEYEATWRLFHWKGFSTIGNVERIADLPLWRGETGVRVLVYNELGHGDAIMAFRFLPELKLRCGVTLVIDQSGFSAAGTAAAGVNVMATLPGDVCDYDCRLPPQRSKSWALEEASPPRPSRPLPYPH